MVNVANNDNGSEPANHHEYGAAISNTGGVGPTETGPENIPGQNEYSEVAITTDNNTKSIMHTHQSYEKVEGVNTDLNTIQMSGTKTTSNFHQSPSNKDINNAEGRTNYTFGMRDRTVYIYNSSGIQATIPLKRFVEPKK